MSPLTGAVTRCWCRGARAVPCARGRWALPDAWLMRSPRPHDCILPTPHSPRPQLLSPRNQPCTFCSPRLSGLQRLRCYGIARAVAGQAPSAPHRALHCGPLAAWRAPQTHPTHFWSSRGTPRIHPSVLGRCGLVVPCAFPQELQTACMMPRCATVRPLHMSRQPVTQLDLSRFPLTNVNHS